jgi:hypothetical protein
MTKLQITFWKQRKKFVLSIWQNFKYVMVDIDTYDAEEMIRELVFKEESNDEKKTTYIQK